MADQGQTGHADHDPRLIASLLDRDLEPVERALAKSWVASCAPCAALYDDLLALSSATRAHPVPPRTRHFTLTAADAARLMATPAGEPSAPAPRLSGVMTDLHASAAHASHDTMLVASLADHSLAASERDAAEALVSSCGDCAALHADLVALMAATRAMPTPSRPREYTLTQDDAVRLRPGGWRRFVAAFGTSRDALSRPLAVGLTTLGLAGLLVANIPSFSFGSAASAPSGIVESVGAPVTGAEPEGATDTSGGGAPAAIPSAAAAAAPPSDGLPVVGAAASAAPLPITSDRILSDGPSPAPGSESVTNGSTKGQGGAPGRLKDMTGTADINPAADASGFSTLVVLSGVFLIAGLGLFGIRWAARRFGDD